MSEQFWERDNSCAECDRLEADLRRREAQAEEWKALAIDIEAKMHAATIRAEAAEKRVGELEREVDGDL